MSKYSDFDVRMKGYEKCSSTLLLPRTPMIIRLDGKSFSSYVKNLTDGEPFSQVMHDAMIYAIINTVPHVMGVKAVYTQSDEITFYLSAECKSDKDTQNWFNNKVQKIVSVLSSIFTRHFNKFMDDNDILGDAYFDARVFNVPDEVEVENNFRWRQQDSVKNSISMLAHYHFSHKSLNKLSGSQKQDRLMEEKGINWNDLPVWMKRGSLVVKVQEEKDVEYTDKRTNKRILKCGVKRKTWKEVECPKFTEKPLIETIKHYLGEVEV